MRQLSLILVALLLLGLPAWAQDEDAHFVSQVLLKTFAKDGAGAAQLILAQPQLAEHAFNVLYSSYAGFTDPNQKKLALGYMNIAARVFESAGRPEFVSRLRAYDLLLEPPQATASPEPSPTLSPSPGQ